jgi:hypothetical protein
LLDQPNLMLLTDSGNLVQFVLPQWWDVSDMTSYGQEPSDNLKTTDICRSYYHVCSNVHSQRPLQGSPMFRLYHNVCACHDVSLLSETHFRWNHLLCFLSAPQTLSIGVGSWCW